MFNRRKKRADELDDVLQALELEGAADAESGVLEPETEMVQQEPKIEDASEDMSAAAGEAGNEDAEEPRRSDPLVGFMLMTSLVLIVVILASTALLVFYLLSLRGAPRTAAERRVAIAEAAVDTEQTKETMLELARAYTQVGRYDDALGTIDRGRRTEDLADYYVAEADVYRVQERYDKALEVYDEAAELDEKEFQALVADLESKGIIVPLERQTKVAILVGKGEALLAKGDDEEALKAFREAAELQPTNALLHVRIGDLFAEAGDVAAATASYEEALRYDPANEDALKGLERVKQAEEE